MFDKVPIFNGDNAFNTLMGIIYLFGYEDIFKLSSWLGVDINPKIYKEV